MTYFDVLDDNPPLPSAAAGLTSEHVERLRTILMSGDRGGFYLAYYELLKQVDPTVSSILAADLDAAMRQVMMQAHISTYSGFLGGAALLGNAMAKYAAPAEYNLPLDQFSQDIAVGLLAAIDDSFALGRKGFLSANAIQAADRGVWNSKSLGEYFPGNYQLMDTDPSQLLTAGTMGAALTGLQIVFGARVGFTPDDYAGQVHSIGDYDVIFDSNGNVVYVEEHIGLVDGLIPGGPPGSAEEPAQLLASILVGAFATSMTIDLAFAAALLLGSNQALAGFALEALGQTILSAFTDTTLDFQLRTRITQFVGAHGEEIAPDGQLPNMVWDKFPIIMRNDGTFVDDGQSHVLFSYNTATIQGGAGEELGFAYANAQIEGGLDSDVLFATNYARIHGQDGNDTLVAREFSLATGGAGEDLLIAADDAQAFGSSGGDTLIGLGRSAINGDDGNDWLVHLGSGEANGGDGDDLIVAIDAKYNGPSDSLSLRGGEGKDRILSFGGVGTFQYGGAGEDLLVGWGGEDHLWGGTGSGDDGATDVFSLSDRTFVHDATAKDYAFWGPFRLTGGVQQWWMEGNWAYWAPISSIVGALPLPLLNGFAAMMMLVDLPLSLAFRYALSKDGQLIIEVGRGRLGTAVIENYELDFDTGEASANIVAFRQVLQKSTLAEYAAYLDFALRAGYGACFLGTDPLVLDLDGDGVELASIGMGTYFDLNADGFAEKTAWVKKDDGFLARDLNGNGKIDDISELFGNDQATGFVQLAALDSNADGKIDSQDAGFSTLRIWQDANGNGVTDAGELKSLTEAGIASISLSTSTPSTTQMRGSELRAEATFTRTNGTTSKIFDVVLRSDRTDTKYLGDGTVSAAAAALPNIKGYGVVRSLAVAMTNDATLLAAVQALAALPLGSSLAALESAVEDILFRWAQVDSVTATAMGTNGFDRQKLAFLEKYFGYELTPRDGSGNPVGRNIEELEDSWAGVLERALVRFAVQGPFESLFTGVSYNASTDRFVSDTASALADAYAAVIAQLSSDPQVANVEWTTKWAPLLSVLNANLIRKDGIDIRTDYVVQSLIKALDSATSPLTLNQLVAGLELTGVHIGTAAGESVSRGDNGGLQVFVGGGGDDTLTGGSGQDVYVYGRNFGHDVINDIEGQLSGDKIRFAVYNPEDVRIERSGLDLLITVIATGDQIRVVGQYEPPELTLFGSRVNPYMGIEEIQFANGKVYEMADIAAAVGLGTNASETIEGSALADEIEGLKGDDILKGGDDGDTYYFTKGDGNDIIHDVKTNTLVNGLDSLILLDGIKPADIKFTRDGVSDDLKITFGWSGDSILLKDQFYYTVFGYGGWFGLENRIEAILFASGGGLSWGEIQQAVIKNYTTSGNDITYGYGTNDQFAASAGNDTLVGLDGGDTYHFGRGSGQDVIDEQARIADTWLTKLYRVDWGAPDSVVFGAGITASDVTFKRTGAAPDLLITINGSTDTLTIKDQFHGYMPDLFGILGIIWMDRVEAFKFADGTTLSWEDVLRIVTTGTGTGETIYGAFYNDTIDGKGGDDFLSGGDMADTYIYRLGDGNDIIDDNQENILVNGADRLKFEPGIAREDISFSRVGRSDDLIITINGTSTITIRGQFYVFDTGVFGVAQFDQIELLTFVNGNPITAAEIRATLVVQAATAGDDTIYGFAFADRLDGGTGNDLLIGMNGDDTYVFGRGYGHDVIFDDFYYHMWDFGGTDTVEFLAGVATTDLTLTRIGTDLSISIAGTSDQLTIKDTFLNYIFMPQRSEIERFKFADGAEWTLSDVRRTLLEQAKTSGNDTITGFVYGDRLDGGAGDDLLDGAESADTYVFGRGYGHDTIYERPDATLADDTHDAVEFKADVLPSDITIERGADPDDLVIRIAGTNDVLTVKGMFAEYMFWSSRHVVELFKFTDGTTWTAEDIRNRLLDEASTAGNDTIRGYVGSETLRGVGGNDSLDGRGGDDTYIYAQGDGNDSIIEGGGAGLNDTLSFAGINVSAVSVEREGQDVILRVAESSPGAGDGGSVRLVGQLSGLWRAGVEKIKFDNGVEWSASTLRALLMSSQQSAGDDNIVGSNLAETLAGGLGSDILDGRGGNDTYQYARGDGNDTIIEEAGGATDTLVLAGINPSDISLIRDGNDLILSIAESTTGAGDGGRIRLDGQLYSGYQKGIEQITFANGSVWTEADLRSMVMVQAATSGDDHIEGLNSSDMIRGGAGNDVSDGAEGSDTYFYARGDGGDVIEERIGNGSADRLVLEGIDAAHVTLKRTDNDVLLLISESSPGANDGGSILLRGQLVGHYLAGVEEIVFADGTVWTEADVEAKLIAAASTDGDDTITGTSSANVIAGGKGNDLIDGRDGDDSYIYRRGDGDDIIEDGAQRGSDKLSFLDITSTEVSLLRIGNDLKLIIGESAPGAGDGGSVLLKGQLGNQMGAGIEDIAFADGIVWPQGRVMELLLAQASTIGNDTIVGFNAADSIRGGRGNDLINGKEWSDTYHYARGDGQDTITEEGLGGGADKLVLEGINPSGVSLVRSGNDVTLVIAETTAGAGDGGSILLKSQLSGIYEQGVEQIAFADGTVWTQSDLRMALLAQASTSGNDVITGFTAPDSLRGGQGNDQLNGKESSDSYYYSRGDGNDTIIEEAGHGGADKLVLEGVNPATVTLSRNGDDVTLIIAESSPGAGNGGSILLKGLLDVVYQTGIEEIVFPNGTVWTKATIRQMLVSASGTPGNDNITGTNAADIISGNGGNDTINGAGGNDTYVYRRGDGNDTITDAAGNGGGDRLVLEGINPSAVSLVRNGNDVTLVIAESAVGAGDGGSILLKAELAGGHLEGVEQIVFADGTVWTQSDMRIALLAQASTSGNDVITGFNAVDSLRGGQGDDQLNGKTWSDTYYYARGDDHDTITEEGVSGGADKLVLEGINPSEVSLVRNGGHVTLVIAESVAGAGDGGSILLSGQLSGGFEQGVEQVVFADGTTWTQADLRVALLAQASTNGNDTIIGFNDVDAIRGGQGDDVINGKEWSDSYYYARGDGNDTITEDAGDGSVDTLVLEGVDPASVTLSRNGDDVTLIIAESAPGVGDGGSVLLKGQLAGNYLQGVEQIRFAGGTVWTQSDLRVILLAQASTSGNDIIIGFNDVDSLRGGQGDDQLNGKAWSDNYYYARGDGNDSITESAGDGNADKLVLEGINPASVTLSRNGDDVTLIIAESSAGAGDGGSIVLKGQFAGNYQQAVEQVVFADGTIWTQANMKAICLVQAATAGDDTITGFSGDDTIAGGQGNDTLSGGSGDDTYVYAAGDGRDYIIDSSGTDKIQLNGIVPADVTVVKNGNNIILLFSQSGGRITIRDQLVAANRIESVLFANGAIWTYQNLEAFAIANDGSVVTHYGTAGADTLTGTSDLDVFQAGLGNDTLSGTAGSDIYLYASGDGSDTINDNSSSTANIDTLKLVDLNPADVTVSRDGQHLKIKVNVTGEIITIQSQFYSATQNWGVERILFADGTSWDLATIRANAWIRGTSGNDTLTGTADVDTIAGYDGNDTLSGASGADTLIGGLGDDAYTVDNAGDVIVENAGEGTDTVQSSVTYTLSADVENLTLTTSGGLGATGNAGANILTGNSGNNVLAGLGGADVLNGGLGTDTATYAASAAGINVSLAANTGSGGDAAGDTFSSIENIIGSDFDDVIEGSGGTNNLNGGAGTDMLSYRNAASAVTVNLSTTTAQSTGGGGSDTLSGFENLTGSSYNDTLTGTAGANTLTGLTGNDSLAGLAGSDTFVFLAGFGKDAIQDFIAGAGSDDIIAFGNDVFADFAAVMAAATQSGADTVITYDANNTVTLKNVTMTNLHADDFSFMAA